jgi:hypothetical protein
MTAFCPILTNLGTHLHILVKRLNLWRFMRYLLTVFSLLCQPCMHLYWSLPRNSALHLMPALTILFTMLFLYKLWRNSTFLAAPASICTLTTGRTKSITFFLTERYVSAPRVLASFRSPIFYIFHSHLYAERGSDECFSWANWTCLHLVDV